MQISIQKYRILNDQKAKVLARLMINQYLQEHHFDVTLNNWCEELGGKPHIIGGPAFNISHSGNMVVVAFGEASIGVDIEKVSDIYTPHLLTFLHAEEKLFLQASPNVHNLFFWIWTRKEAYLKAMGHGIMGGLSSINVLHDTVFMGDGTLWQIREAAIEQDYQCHVCSNGSLQELFIEEFLVESHKH